MIKIEPPERGLDAQGSGAFKAPRGDRKHNGVDFACLPKSRILAVSAGRVTKIGYPYDPNKHPEKAHLRYVQVTDKEGIDVRYFYVDPLIRLNDDVGVNGCLGTSQDLRPIYPGITPHFHFEVKHEGAIINPIIYLRAIKE